jgi:uridine kinase
LLNQLAARIVTIRRPHPVRVAIDGVDTAGKTTLADELVEPIAARGRPVIRASIDGFHRPREERYRRGPDSAEGYYLDSFDHAALRAALLDPLGPGGSRKYRRARFDWRTDEPVDAPVQLASPDAILLFDGVFLLRPELADAWDLHIFVHVDFKEVLKRAVERDGGAFGSAEALQARYHQRYIPGQRLYLETARPRERADVVIDNNDLANPELRGPR